jgi:N-acetylneuraminic acid mutarotase
MEISMRKNLALLLVLVFLTASCLIAVKPASSSADAAENSWASKAPMHQARAGLGVAVVNGKIYAIGGNTWEKESAQHTTGGVVGTNEEYDPATDTWTFKASMPTPREAFAIAVCQNRIYCIDEGVNEVYDPATDTWENKTPMPTARTGLQANVVNGKIHLIGGYPNKTLNEVYDPTTDTWTTKVPMPTEASGYATSYASAVVDNKIYIIDSNLNQIYDAETDTWSIGAPMPFSAIYTFAGATTGVNAPKRIYVFGGGVTRVYDPENDSWTAGVDVPTNRDCFGVAVVNDLLYVIGGFTQIYRDYPDDWMYGPSVTKYATNEQYTPFGYGTVPPVISVVSPEDQTYNATGVDLIFAVNKPAVWLGYSLDGQDNVTITSNTTLAGLSSGLHNITVYAKDAFENMGASETISFTVAKEPEPFPTTLVAVASAVSVSVVGLGFLFYFKRSRTKNNRADNK